MLMAFLFVSMVIDVYILDIGLLSWKVLMFAYNHKCPCCGQYSNYLSSSDRHSEGIFRYLNEISSERVSPSTLLKTFKCLECGAIWRYQLQFVGHADVEWKLAKLEDM